MDQKKYRLFFLRIGLVVAIVGALLLTLSGTLFKNWIIISFGVRAYGKVLMVEASLGGSGAFFALGCCIPIIGAKIQQERHSRILTQSADDVSTPDFVKARLNQLEKELPWSREIVRQCQDQMFEMDAMQERQEALIAANSATYLQRTVDVFNNVERRICRNFQSIINLYIVAGNIGGLEIDKVCRILNDNRDKLDAADQLLRLSVDWINQYNTDKSADHREVDDWIETIRMSLKED